MKKIKITGEKRLKGEVTVQGAKNAVLPVLAATVLAGGECVIYNCPHLTDVNNTVEILKALGAEVSFSGNTLTVNTKNADGTYISEHLMRKMRSSIIFMGALLARNGRAKISVPGGCELGPRPIDLHIDALKSLGIEIKERHGYILCEAKNLKSNNVFLKFPSVGATENIMLASCLIPGETVIFNAAREPEIEELAQFLNSMGAKIEGAGSSKIHIFGVDKLKCANHTVMPDRIVASTYLCCAAATGGEVLLKKIRSDHLASVLHILKETGCEILSLETSVKLKAPERLIAPGEIKTMPYPGFPTDSQSLMLSLLTKAKGTSIITENIFQSRFRHAEELIRMGADITIAGRSAIIKGKESLMGAELMAHDLRGAASLVIAGLSASGETVIDNMEYLDRGYEKFYENLRELGAEILPLS